MECSGLEAEVEPVDYREGNEPVAHVRKIPGLVKYARLTLKRGLTSDTTLFDWFSSVRKGISDQREVTVVLLDEAKQPVMRWNFHKALPVKWSGPALNAKGNDIAIESLELVHEGFDLGKP